MAKRTKKVGATGRYGPRYGVTARKKILSVELRQRAKHVCDRCGAPAVKRTSTSVFACRKCGHTFAGGAYVPVSGSGLDVQKALRGINDKLAEGADTAELVPEILARTERRKGGKDEPAAEEEEA